VNSLLLPNNDGIDGLGCRHVHISDCEIAAGDDEFAFYGSEGVGVTNCSLVSHSAGIRMENTRWATFSDLKIHSNRGIGIFERNGTTANDQVRFAIRAPRKQVAQLAGGDFDFAGRLEIWPTPFLGTTSRRFIFDSWTGSRCMACGSIGDRSCRIIFRMELSARIFATFRLTALQAGLREEGTPAWRRFPCFAEEACRS
jgi:hypothetical protein